MQRRSVYDNDSFHYVTKGADSEQPVGAPCYQWVGCRDHAGIACFPHSGSWQAQEGPAYICKGQIKHVFYDMGPLNLFYLYPFYHSELPPLPPTTTPRPGASTTTPPTTTTTTTTHAPGSGFCNGKPDGLYANPDDRTSFYMCAGGITHVRYCGSGSVFDESCKCCVWP